MWKNIILYTFLVYVLLHLIIDDVLLVLKFMKKSDNQECTHDNLNIEETRTLVKIFNKICDITLQSVLGYFDCFKTCWLASVECLEKVMSKYIDFLDSLAKTFLHYPTCLITCFSAISCMVIASVMLKIIVD